MTFEDSGSFLKLERETDSAILIVRAAISPERCVPFDGKSYAGKHNQEHQLSPIPSLCLVRAFYRYFIQAAKH